VRPPPAHAGVSRAENGFNIAGIVYYSLMRNEVTIVTHFEEVVCPRCNIGFAPDTVQCPICKTVVVTKSEYRVTTHPVVLHDDLSSLAKLRTAGVKWIYRLQDQLAEAGIPHRTELSDPPHVCMSFSVYVRPQDLLRAQAIDEKIFVNEVPESEGMHRVEDLDFWSCPACGNHLGERELSCGNCGLVLSPPEGRRCNRCGEMITIDAPVCPHCGCNIS
jgi:RNA polymerase subunit RPABC4/transcription elongation factor Spt4